MNKEREKETIRVLLIEDDPGDVDLIQGWFRKPYFHPFDLAHADGLQEGLGYLARERTDVVLLDLSLPDSQGLASFVELSKCVAGVPIVILTGSDDEGLAMECVRRGAQDYLVKGHMDAQALSHALRYAIERDVTERKQIEKEILEISEREQERIGQDLHDELGQVLTAVAFLSKGLEQKSAAKARDEFAADAAEISRLIHQAISELKGLARGLYPVALEAHGLMTALQELATPMEKRFDISCVFECKEPVLIRDHAVARHLYRIAQEAVNNAIKHGHAKRISIALTSVHNSISLAVRDDGLGLPEEWAKHQGMGLRIMRYRAAMIGASLEIQRNGRKGTSVTCSYQEKAKIETDKEKAVSF